MDVLNVFMSNRLRRQFPDLACPPPIPNRPDAKQVEGIPRIRHWSPIGDRADVFGRFPGFSSTQDVAESEGTLSFARSPGGDTLAAIGTT